MFRWCRRSWPMVAVLLFSFWGWNAWATELRCTVRNVSAGTVTLTCEGGAAPRFGDPVTLGFEAPGVGFVAVEGSWQISLVGPGGEVQAAPVSSTHGEPQVGHLAIVESSAPTMIAPTPRPRPTARPPQPYRPPAGGTGVHGPAGQLRDDSAQLPPVATYPRLGVAYEESAQGAGGLRVISVSPGGAADLAGVRTGDAIIALDQRPTTSGAVLLSEIRRRRPNQLVTLTVLRAGRKLELNAILQVPSLEDPSVQLAIGRAFLDGVGVAPDRSQAELWLGRAAAAGRSEAVELLAMLRGSRTAQPALAAPQQAWSSTTQTTPRGVYIVGTESGNRSVLYQVDPAIRQVVMGSGASVLQLPRSVSFAPGNAPDPQVVSRQLGGSGWLLYLRLKLKWANLGFAKDRITVECYDPSGNLQWSEDANNVFASSRDQSTQIIIDKITKKLRGRAGQACLRP